MAYPDDIGGAALCYVDGGCRWHGGVCSECGARLRCDECGQFLNVDTIDGHYDENRCPTLARMYPEGTPDDT